MRFSERHKHSTRAWDYACRSHQEQPIFTRIGEVLSPWYAVSIVLSLCGAHAAYGADVSVDQLKERLSIAAENSTWVLQVTSYIWAAGLKGNISAFRRASTISVEKSFSDVVDDLNFGGLINFWGRYDRFVFSSDIMYVDTTGGHGRGPLPALQLPGFGITIPPGVSVDTEQFMVTMQGGYRVVDTPQFTLDVLAGVRFWYISNDVRVMASHSVIGTRRASHGEDFGRGCRDKLTLAVSAQIPISYGRRW
ncbi:hypothetical protein [Nitrosomonas sp.]|uniref:hypothetical protein n=2 Tax=Nitrosomonas sp. TaxID=42353 RepID=UPI0037C99CF0